MDIEVFKFGGASVNSAQAVQNMASIVKSYHDGGHPMVIVVSAMGKTTNALEQLVPGVKEEDEQDIVYKTLVDYHLQIVRHLFPNPADGIYDSLRTLFANLDKSRKSSSGDYNYDYDQVVSYGELLSTTVISAYLAQCGVENQWVDVRKVIVTDSAHRCAQVDWERTMANRQQLADILGDGRSVVTQGFIASAADGSTTTLGREGSDYSAAVLSYLLDSKRMTIWKDVPGFLNADPKYFADTVKIDEMPYDEAIEQAYYGASVIHPKTIKPLQNKQIPLYIKSFVNPVADGSVVGPFPVIKPEVPLYIFKENQVLMSIMPKDFSFIAEENLQRIFSILSQVGVSVNLMQNTALSFSICIDSNKILIDKLIALLSVDFKVRYNSNMELVTVRHYTQEVVDSIVGGRQVFLEQRSRATAQLVVEN
ncbi:MAG: aspartate kinase [Bacteroidales bacterium]|nr:aspartate kinase [Bacteroidales bacterium]